MALITLAKLPSKWKTWQEERAAFYEALPAPVWFKRCHGDYPGLYWESPPISKQMEDSKYRQLCRLRLERMIKMRVKAARLRKKRKWWLELSAEERRDYYARCRKKKQKQLGRE